MHRKGFPESYDVRRALEFLIDVKSGKSHVTAPVYSHLTYDIVPGSVQEVNRPDIMIFEGLNVLQGPQRQQGRSLAVSDFFDFSIYIDADAADIERWYIDRFMTLRETVFTDLRSYFHKYSVAHRRRGAGDGPPHLARRQLREPEGEHRAHTRTRASHPAQGRASTRSRVCGCGNCEGALCAHPARVRAGGAMPRDHPADARGCAHRAVAPIASSRPSWL